MNSRQHKSLGGNLYVFLFFVALMKLVLQILAPCPLYSSGRISFQLLGPTVDCVLPVQNWLLARISPPGQYRSQIDRAPSWQWLLSTRTRDRDSRYINSISLIQYNVEVPCLVITYSSLAASYCLILRWVRVGWEVWAHLHNFMSQFCIIIREEGNDISSYYSLTKALNLIRKYGPR